MSVAGGTAASPSCLRCWAPGVSLISGLNFMRTVQVFMKFWLREPGNELHMNPSAKSEVVEPGKKNFRKSVTNRQVGR